LGLLQRIPSLEISLNSIEIQLKTGQINMQIATAIYHTLCTNTETCPMRIEKAKSNSFYNKAKTVDNKADTSISSDLVRGFIGGFQDSAQPYTVYVKATLLVRLCRFARQYFGKIPGARTPSILAHIDETANLLSGYCRVEKATSRRQTAVLRDQNTKGPIGPVCDIIKQGISNTFRDSESSSTWKFIYVLRLGITPLMLKSFISSVRLVNSLY
jgi:hypothetical protein